MDSADLTTAKAIYAIFEKLWADLEKAGLKPEIAAVSPYYIKHAPNEDRLELIKEKNGKFEFRAYSKPMQKQGHGTSKRACITVYPDMVDVGDAGIGPWFNPVAANAEITNVEVYLNQFCSLCGLELIELPLFNVPEITEPADGGSPRKEIRQGHSKEKHNHKPKKAIRGIDTSNLVH